MAKNINTQHSASLSTTEYVALYITNKVGTFQCAIIFAIIGIMGVYGAMTNNLQMTLIIGSISGYFLQLVLLPLILLGQNLQSRHSEMRAEEDFEINIKAEQEIEEINRKLDLILKK